MGTWLCTAGAAWGASWRAQLSLKWVYSFVSVYCVGWTPSVLVAMQRWGGGVGNASFPLTFPLLMRHLCSQSCLCHPRCCVSVPWPWEWGRGEL